ncbi:MAG: flagellar type III secretion system protein FlhB [Sphingomonadales bacterium]
MALSAAPFRRLSLLTQRANPRARPGMARLSESLKGIIGQADMIPVEGDHILILSRVILMTVASVLMLPLILFVVAALAGTMVQHRPVFTAEKIKPQLQKISPLAGFKRLFSAQSLVEFLKTVAKFAIVASVVALLILPEAARLPEIVSYDVAELLPMVQALTIRMVIGVVAIMAIIAGLDFLFQHFQHLKKMRMTKQEIKDEHKQTDGDPHVKARLRQLRAERSRKRMMAAVPEADVIITNPTHFAVAMKYEGNTMEAPRVVAKGVDHMARRIRELAAEHDIPIIENPPLARTLYAAVDVDREIAPEHYRAVAEVISFIMRKRRNRR